MESRDDEALSRADPGKIKRFERLKAGPFFGPVVETIRAYSDVVIPDASATEAGRWALSCLPSTFPNRLAAISMKWMEMLVLSTSGRLTDPVEAYIVVRRSVLDREFATDRPFQQEHPRLGLKPCGYRDAGDDQVGIWGPHTDLIAALDDDRVGLAAHALAANLMESRTAYGRAHNYHLADAVFGRKLAR